MRKVHHATDNKKRRKGYISKREQRELQKKVKDCDDEAFGRLYTVYFGALRGFIASQIRNWSEAEDLAHDTFLEARRNIHRQLYDPKYSFYKFLYNIALNSIKRFRTNQKKGSFICSVAAPDLRSGKPNSLRLDDSNILMVFLYLEGFRLIASSQAKPHHILIFGFVEYLHWKPREIVEQHHHKRLGVLAEEFFRSYWDYHYDLLDKNSFRRYYLDFFEWIKKPVREIYREKEYGGRLKLFSSHRLRDLPLNIFFTRNPEACISDWCHKVIKAARKAQSKENPASR